MSRRMKVFISVLVLILLMTIGGTATFVMAQEDNAEPEEEDSTVEVALFLSSIEDGSLLARVAEILDITEEELVAAFKQARQELKEEKWTEALNEMLDLAVEEGLLTEAEAEEIREWWEQKPDVLDRGLLQHAFNSWRSHDGSMPGLGWGKRLDMESMPHRGPNLRAWQKMAPQAFDIITEKAIAKERLTLEQVNRLREWRQSGPESVGNQSPRAFKAMRGRHMGAFPGGWNGPPLD
jgi:hypothetical protein